MPDDRAGMKDYISENDSVLDVVNQMDKDNVIDMSGDINEDAGAVVAKMGQMENEIVDLKLKLNMAERQIEDMIEEKEKQDEESGQSLIPQLKGVFIQFLRNVAITNPQNEVLLTVIFNMLEFTEVEI